MRYLVQYLLLLKKGWLTSKRFQFVVITMIFVALIKISPWKIVLVGSKSIEVGLYFLDETVDERKRGRQYCFDNHKPDWVHHDLKIPSHQVSCKYLIGVPGDKISVEGQDVVISFVDSDPIFGDSKVERRFTRISEIEGKPVGYEGLPETIPAGSYYFGSDFEFGWDSRYVGLIKDDKIIGGAKLLKAFKKEV